MTQTKAERLAAVHARAAARFDAIWNAVKDERKQCLEDRRFYSIAGAQWEGDDGYAEQFANAPRFEINKTHEAVVAIFSDYRKNRITVDFRPKDKAADPETAESLDGLYRADEEECGAQEAYDNAFEEGVGGGMGAWRLRACYEDEEDPENDYQRIRIEPIYDADQSVFFDLDAKRQDKRDARHAFLISSMSPDAFTEQYGREPSSFGDVQTNFEWFQPEVVFVAEYYEIEEEAVTKRYFRHAVIEEERVEIDADPELLEKLALEGWTESRTRKVKRPRVHKYIISGAEVLEDEGRIAGKSIPIVPYYGKRWFVNNIERCAGKVRWAKDPARLYNAEVSALAEISGMAQHERPILTPEQVRGHETSWAEGNIKRSPYQLVNPIYNEDGTLAQLGPVGKVEPATVPQALAALIQIAGQDIAELTGANQQLESVPANTSAQAIESVHSRADDKNFIYLDNMAKAMKRCGEIWREMAADLYVEEGREMPVLDHEGEKGSITLAEPALDKDGREILRNDFTRGRFDVVVDVGPASTTRRDATVRSLVNMAQSAANDPELQNVLISTALVNMDGEGIGEVQDWIRARLVRQGVLKPTDEEAAAMQEEAANAQPDPQAEVLKAAAEQAASEARKNDAQAEEIIAKAGLTEAKTLTELAGIAAGTEQELIQRAALVTNGLPAQPLQ